MSFINSSEDIKEQAEVLYQNEQISESSGEEPPMEEWSSLVLKPLKPYNLENRLLIENPCEEICTTYIRQSDSSLFTLSYYNYPGIFDPGIKEALLEAIPPHKPYPDDGYQLYMDLCKEFNLCPVRLFYSHLLNTEINLRYYCPTSRNVRIMAIALKHNEYVKRLDLTDSYLDLDACYHLGEMLKSNRTLEELILDGCQIREAGLRRLGANMSDNCTLQTISLARNDLDDGGGKLFANIIESGAHFTRVNLSYNKLGVKTTTALSEALMFKNNITHLDISWNPFVNVGSTATFLKVLANTGNVLQELNLSYIGFDNVRTAEAIAAITLLPKLTILNLSNNRFSDDCAGPLVSNLAASKLHTYDLSNNFFSPLGACSILRMFTIPRVKVRKLYLDNICVNRNFMATLQNVRKMKSRKNFIVTFDKVLHDWVAIGDDPRSLILRRGDFMGKMKKKAPKDVPMFLLSLSYTVDSIRAKELIVMMKDQKIPVNDDWVDGLIQAFPGPLIDKKPTVDAKKMREYIRRIWPDLKLPPDWKPPVMIRVEVKHKKVVKRSKSALAVKKKKKK